MKLYVDTCIWIDFLENRKSSDGKPLGLYAYAFLKRIINKETVFLSDMLLLELKHCAIDFSKIKTAYAETNDEQKREAIDLALKLCVPLADALHAVISRDNNAIMITRDNHFRRFSFIHFFTPEDFLKTVSK